MQKNRKWVLTICAIAAAILLMGGIYTAFGPKASAGAKAYTLEVVDDQAVSKTYEGRTDSAYLREVLDELAAQGDFSYEASDGEYGLYIEAVNGLEADYSRDGAYWAIYVNGEYGQYGADSQPVADGDAFRLVYEK